jgi:DNA-binding response OmpR family regulator
MRVLVVEDDPVLQDGLTVGLGIHGVTAEGVATCADALAALETTAFDAVVLDVMLPDGSGFDVLRTLRQRNDTVPVLLLTALDAVSDRIRGLDDGADDYLGKPFDLDEVAARLRALRRRSVVNSRFCSRWSSGPVSSSRRPTSKPCSTAGRRRSRATPSKFTSTTCEARSAASASRPCAASAIACARRRERHPRATAATWPEKSGVAISALQRSKRPVA